MKGALDRILELCNGYLDGGRIVRPMGANDRDRFMRNGARIGLLGLRGTNGGVWKKLQLVLFVF